MRREPVDVQTGACLVFGVVVFVLLLSLVVNACTARKGLERIDAPTSSALSVAVEPPTASAFASTMRRTSARRECP